MTRRSALRDRGTSTASPAAIRASRCASSLVEGAGARAVRDDDGARSTRPSTSSSSARSPRVISCSSTRVWRSPVSVRRAHEVRRRVPRRRARPRARRRDRSPPSSRPPLQGHGSVRRAHALDLQVRRRRPAARRTSSSCTGPAARSASSRWAASTTASRSRASPSVIFTCFGDMLRVPGVARHAARRQGRGRRRAHGLLAARRAADRASENPDRKVVFFAIGFETTAPSTALTLARQGRGHRELLVPLQPRHDRAAAARAAGVARPAARRLHRPGPVAHGRRRAAVRVHPGRLRPSRS